MNDVHNVVGSHVLVLSNPSTFVISELVACVCIYHMSINAFTTLLHKYIHTHLKIWVSKCLLCLTIHKTNTFLARKWYKFSTIISDVDNTCIFRWNGHMCEHVCLHRSLYHPCIFCSWIMAEKISFNLISNVIYRLQKLQIV